MLFVLIGLLLVASVFVLLMKKNRESLYLLGMCCSLMVQFSGILIFIAKKGGYSKSIIGFLFFSQRLRNKLQYLFITLDTLGYVIAVGRYLFPLFLDGNRAAIFHDSVGQETPQYQEMGHSAARAVAGHLRPGGVQDDCRQVAVHASGAGGDLLLVDHRLRGRRADAAGAGIVFHHHAVLQAAVCGHCGLSGGAEAGCTCSIAGRTQAQVYQFYSYDYVWNKASAICNTRRR